MSELILCTIVSAAIACYSGVDKLRPLSDAPNSATLLTEFRSILNGMNRSQLEALANHVDESIALQAAWELVQRTIPDERIDGDSNSPVRTKHVQWFLGFVQGRLRLRPPKWWRSQMLNMRPEGEPGVLYANRKPKGDFQIAPIAHGLSVSGKTVAYLDNGDIVLRHNDQSVRIPSSIIDEEHGLEAIDGISACFSEERVYVCLYSTGSGAKTVRCFRLNDGEQLWAAIVFAGYPHAPAWVSSRRDYVDLRLAEDSVVVFGSTGQSFFIEAFYFKSGAPRFRFSTSYGSAR